MVLDVREVAISSFKLEKVKPKEREGRTIGPLFPLFYLLSLHDWLALSSGMKNAFNDQL